MLGPKRFETCARCGHQAGECPNCTQRDPFLGASMDGRTYCHTFSTESPTCYTLTSWEVTERALDSRLDGIQDVLLSPTDISAPEEIDHEGT